MDSTRDQLTVLAELFHEFDAAVLLQAVGQGEVCESKLRLVFLNPMLFS